MVRARRPSKGADWLARERGLVSPNFTSTCARLFQQRGNPWLTNDEQSQDYPLNRSRMGDEPLTDFEVQAADIAYRADKAFIDIRYHEAKQKARDIEDAKERVSALRQLRREYDAEVDALKAVVRRVLPSIVVDPDMDMYTKAGRAEERPKYVDPPGTPIVADAARRRVNLAHSRAPTLNLPGSNLMIARHTEVVNVREPVPRPKKVKGNFYRFDDVAEKVPPSAEVHYKPRPFFGRPVSVEVKRPRRGK